MKTIRFTAHHGKGINSITATGETLDDAIKQLHTQPLGYYAINKDHDSYPAFIAELTANGKAKFGWGDWEVIPPSPVNLDALISPLPIDGEPAQCVEMCISENVGPEGAFARLRFARSSDAVAFLMDNFTKDNLEGLNFEIANYYKR